MNQILEFKASFIKEMCNEDFVHPHTPEIHQTVSSLMLNFDRARTDSFSQSLGLKTCPPTPAQRMGSRRSIFSN